MKDSPFIYGTTVSAHSFTNREQESLKLKSNLLNGINTMIISPRRWGKSSLVEKVILEIKKKEKKTKTVMIDLFSVSSEEEFLELFAREVLKASSGKWQEWINTGKEFFKKLIPKFSMTFQESDFGLSFDWKELKKHSEEVLDLPELIAKKKGIRFIICLDEFQNLSSFSTFSEFEKKMRACWQRHHSVTYCMYGSKRHMMTDIFNNPAKPFYRFGDIMLLQKIEEEKWIRFICKSFLSSGKLIPANVAVKIPQLMKNHSWYVQQLAHYTWNLTQKKANNTEIEAALNELIRANSPLYQKEVENLSNTQINLLKAVAKAETKFTSTFVMQNYQLGTPRNVSKNKQILIGNDLIHEINDVFEFLDPAFELWFKKQFFNIPYLIKHE
ncbi:MAG: ATP-binding protein [Bacteroidota bacterium]|nr:ATP-binding protein [Bacteroidota bacterium]